MRSRGKAGGSDVLHRPFILAFFILNTPLSQMSEIHLFLTSTQYFLAEAWNFRCSISYITGGYSVDDCSSWSRNHHVGGN